jgi:regulator of cell morphogenesis and NO signaling
MMKQEFDLALPDLLYFVRESCHVSLHDALPVLQRMTRVVSTTHAHHAGFPQELPKFIRKFIKKLQLHLILEEQNLYPFIEGGLSPAGIATLVHLEDDHHQMKNDLMTLRRLTDNYCAQESLDLNVHRFYEMLKEMDRIILNHIQIEDNILFPMVKRTS